MRMVQLGRAELLRNQPVAVVAQRTARSAAHIVALELLELA